MALNSISFSKSYIRQNLLNDDFVKHLQNHLVEIKDLNTSEIVSEKLFSLIENVIETIETTIFTSNASKTILYTMLCLCNCIECLTMEQTVDLTEKCLGLIRNSYKKKDENMNGCIDQIWKTIIPKVFEVLEKTPHFEQNGSRVTGKKYRTFMIDTICSIKLNSQLIIPLTSMWIDINLTDEEHTKVVKSLCSILNKSQIQPNQIPPFIHQILILTKDRNSILVILKLRDFLVENLYNGLNGKQTQDAIGHDIENSYGHELIEAESTIIYHIEESARFSRTLVTDLIKLMKSIQSLPQNCLDPFILALLLSVSTMPMYEAEIIKIMKTVIMNCFIEMDHRHNSAWIRKEEAQLCDVESVFKILIESKVANKEKIRRGLLNISFKLLCTNVTPKHNQIIVDKMRRSGRYMIILLIKHHKLMLSEILEQLRQYMFNSAVNYQFTDTLHQIVAMYPYMFGKEQESILNNLVTSMARVPHRITQRIIIALLPITKFNIDLCNTLLLTLRQMLYSNNVNVRETAVFGFLNVLKQNKLKQPVSTFSQNSLNQLMGPSLFTQMILDVNSSQSQHTVATVTQSNSNRNETTCLEVLGKLRRCLSEPCIVKDSLYKGLLDCFNTNSELYVSFMDLLLEHFRQFYILDSNILPPLNFDKIIQLDNKNGDYMLSEPVAKLILVLGQMINNNKVHENIELESTFITNVETIKSKLDSLVSRFMKCNIDTFELDGGSMEVTYKKEILIQILGLYEALMAYKLYSFNIESSIDHVNDMLGLFKQYNLFLDFVSSQPKTKTTKKVDNLTQKNTQNKKEDKINLNIKLPITILNLKILYKYLQIFFEDNLDWISVENIQKIKERRSFFHYILNTILHVVQSFENDTERKSSDIYKDFCNLSKILYESVLIKYEEFQEFDSKLSLVSLKIFYVIITCIFNHYDNKVGDFLHTITKENNGLRKQILSIVKLYHPLVMTHLEKLQELDNGETEIDNDEHTDICQTLEVSLNTLVKIVLKVDNDSKCIKSIQDWSIHVCDTYEIKNKHICKLLVDFMLTLVTRESDDITMLNNISIQLGCLYGTINDDDVMEKVNKLDIINEKTKAIVVPIVCDYINRCINYLEWFLIRLKSHYIVMELYRSENEDDLKKKEKHMIQYCTIIGTIIKYLSNIQLPVELTQPCLKLIIKFYQLLNNITKYYLKNNLTSYKNSNFINLVSFVIKLLYKQISLFLCEIEQNSNKKNDQLIPKIILEQENFNKLILILRKKYKDSTLSNVFVVPSRDYRLDVKQLQMNLQNQEKLDETSENLDTTNEADTADEPSTKRSRLDSSPSDVTDLSSTY